MIQQELVYVRRGDVIKGPASAARVRALLHAHKLSFSDLVATSPQGPWRRLAEVFASELTRVPVVTDFRMKKKFFGSGYVANYSCPHCRALLHAEEANWGSVDICPTCNRDHRIAREAREQADSNRRAIAAEEAQRAREREQLQQRQAEKKEAERIRKAQAKLVHERERAAREAAQAAEQEAARERRLAEPSRQDHAGGAFVGDIIESADAIQSLFDLFSGE